MNNSDVATATGSASAEALASDIERLGERLRQARQSIERVIFGQQAVIDQTLIALLSGGHVLLIGVPGLAKTRLVETLHVVLGLEERRVQCTPDLMPADILGSEVLEEEESGRRSFRFIPGPVFCQLLMADEVNRASPRTQSALLQAMQERRVTIAGRAHPLPEPFHVVATQNPLEQEGTYPLPEAQLDRFLLQIDIGYPDIEAERQMLIATTGLAEDKPKPVMSAADLIAGPAADPAHPRGQERGRGDPGPGARRPARYRRPRRGDAACGLGPGATGKPGADAGRARARRAGRPALALGR